MPVMQYQTFKTREIQQTECEKLRRQAGEGGKILGEKINLIINCTQRQFLFKTLLKNSINIKDEVASFSPLHSYKSLAVLTLSSGSRQ
jgi:hypothetical protein